MITLTQLTLRYIPLSSLSIWVCFRSIITLHIWPQVFTFFPNYTIRIFHVSIPSNIFNYNHSIRAEDYWLQYLATINNAAKKIFKVKVKVTQSCLTLCNPMDYIVHGSLQARILEWVAYPFSKGSSQPRDQAQVFRTAGRFFTSWATKEAK